MDLTSITNRCSKLLPYTYGFFMCAFLLFPSPKSHNTLFYLTVLAPALLLFGKQFSHLIKNNLPYRLIIIFIVYCALSVLWSPEVEFSPSLKVFRHALYPVIFVTITVYFFETTPNIFNKIFFFLIIAAVIGAAANIVFWYKDHPFPYSRLIGWGRFENPIVIGCSYGMIAVITVTRAFRAENNRNMLIYFATTIAFLGFIILTQSKLALISLSITLLISAFIHFSRRSIILFLAAALVFALYLWLEPEVFRRFSIEKAAVSKWKI